VWVHDYQLALVPELLRELGVEAPIGFFLHIPFPSVELYAQLPVREPFLRGLLGADLIGFHVHEYLSHFRTACLRLLGQGGEPGEIRLASRRVQLCEAPVGIEPSEIRAFAGTVEARRERQALCEAHPG